jgi:hypothetical protein
MMVYPLKKMKICRWGLRKPQVGVGRLKAFSILAPDNSHLVSVIITIKERKLIV